MHMLLYLTSIYSSLEAIKLWNLDFNEKKSLEYTIGFDYLETYCKMLKSFTENRNHRWSDYLLKNEKEREYYPIFLNQGIINSKSIETGIVILEELLQCVRNLCDSFPINNYNVIGATKTWLEIQERIRKYEIYLNSDEYLKYAFTNLGNPLLTLYISNRNNPKVLRKELCSYISRLMQIDPELELREIKARNSAYFESYSEIDFDMELLSI
ncbi:hypothetical protein H312_02997 [Anncaliia algerae PRA339]|uniref:Uncharacterized protein n=1 Tax=Anncaliia algerae PRA339 TaxID=1288291 RepID=A0A059EY35_9MICR|nr:hypothetical protein H312_02997 [Anncaliia algerae PRA339]